jgi:hypothetical protein
MAAVSPLMISSAYALAGVVGENQAMCFMIISAGIQIYLVCVKTQLIRQSRVQKSRPDAVTTEGKKD